MVKQNFEKSKIEESSSNSSFTFGDGLTYQSLKRINLPCWINGTKACIEVDVVDCNIPMLLGKKAMKKGKMIIDFNEDTVQMAGKVIKLRETTSGHYLLPLKF